MKRRSKTPGKQGRPCRSVCGSLCGIISASDECDAAEHIFKKKEEARKQAEKHAAQASSKYDQDVRVRTGAYRIIGVSEVVTAREGQTIKSLSQKYLGPGMECYVEALNGTSLLKPGQKVKIPKLELKKKK